MAEPQNTEETQKMRNTQEQTDTQSEQTAGDADNAKATGIIGYLMPILFFLPMVMDMKNNDFAMYHANQQLNLLLFWVIGNIVSWILMFILIGFLLWAIIWIFGVILVIMGIINVVNEEKKPLPLIGGISLLK